MMEDGKKPNRLLGRERRGEGGREERRDPATARLVTGGKAKMPAKRNCRREEQTGRRKLGVAPRLWVYPPTLLGRQEERAVRTRSGHQQAETEAECICLGKEVGEVGGEGRMKGRAYEVQEGGGGGRGKGAMGGPWEHESRFNVEKTATI